MALVTAFSISRLANWVSVSVMPAMSSARSFALLNASTAVAGSVTRICFLVLVMVHLMSLAFKYFKCQLGGVVTTGARDYAGRILGH